MFQISFTYAFTEVVHVQSDTLENTGNVDGKSLRRIFRSNWSRLKHNLNIVACFFDGKMHVFVLKSVVLYVTDLRQYKRVCGNGVYNPAESWELLNDVFFSMQSAELNDS